MPLLRNFLTHGRHRLWNRPQGRLRVDMSHPISNSLRACFIPTTNDATEFKDLLRPNFGYGGTLNSSIQGNASWDRDVHGLAFVTGSTGYARLASPLGGAAPYNFGQTKTTIEFWIKTTTQGGVLLGFYAANSPFGGFGIGIYTPGSFGGSGTNGSITYWTSNVGSWQQPSTINVADGLLHHGVVVADIANPANTNGDRLRIYIDGQLSAEVTNIVGQLPGTYNGTQRVIGASESGSLPFNGRIYMLRLWARALTGTEIAELYNKPWLNISGQPWNSTTYITEIQPGPWLPVEWQGWPTCRPNLPVEALANFNGDRLPLPIELIGTLDERDLVTILQGASEQLTDFFVIEKSTDVQDLTPLDDSFNIFESSNTLDDVFTITPQALVDLQHADVQRPVADADIV